MSLPDLPYILWDVTWANNVAALELMIAASAATLLFQNLIGRRVSSWWARHSGHGEHHEATRRHVSDELVSLEQRLMARFDEIESRIRGAGGN